MPHQASIAHHVRGRIRVKMPSARGNSEVLRQVAESLGSKQGVRSVECNVKTGSIVVQYDDSQHSDFADALATHGQSTGLFSLAPPELSEIDQMAQSIEREAEFLAQHSDAARRIVDGFKTINYGLRRATNNNVDLKVLLPLGMAAWAFVEHDPELATPLWLTLTIFSFNSFIALHPPLPSVAVSTQQMIRREDNIPVEDRTTILRPQPGSR